MSLEFENVLARLGDTRSRLEKRFSDFEHSVSRQLRLYGGLEQALSAKGSAAPERAPGAPEKLASERVSAAHDVQKLAERHAEELARMKREMDSLRAQNHALDETLARSRDSLKVMGVERQELTAQIQAMEEEMESLRQAAAARQAAPEPEAPADDPRLAILMRLQAKRQRSARFWKHHLDKYRYQKKQLTKWTAELDAANELIAELRDELQAFDPFHSGEEKK